MIFIRKPYPCKLDKVFLYDYQFLTDTLTLEQNNIFIPHPHTFFKRAIKCIEEEWNGRLR
jgi:hypothetical protein